MRNRWKCGLSADADMQPKATRSSGIGFAGQVPRHAPPSPLSPAHGPSPVAPPSILRPLEITKHHTTQRGRDVSCKMCLVAGINPFIMFYHSHAHARADGGRRERPHCDQKNFWGVRSLVAAADRRDQILYRRTSRSLRAIEPSVVATAAAAHAAWFVA